MKILLCDTLYPDFIASLSFNPAGTYESELRAVLDQKFGTFDAMSVALRTLGHECVDVIANHDALQQKWAHENDAHFLSILEGQITRHDPDVVFFQDLSIVSTVNFHIGRKTIAGQLSCPWPGDGIVSRFDVLFSSFPHYIPRIQALGVRAVYLPLAFEPSVLEGPQPERDIDISFVGGVGRDSHWKSGTDTLEIVAGAFRERFHWYGYGLENLSDDSPLRECYRGQAWGLAQYDVYRRSLVVINRHGEVAEGVAQNLRMYEATGCGAMLLTDNTTDLFVASNGVNVDPEIVLYDSPAQAEDLLEHFMYPDRETRAWLDTIARNGQACTLRDHTYSQRMKTVSEVLTEMLCPA